MRREDLKFGVIRGMVITYEEYPAAPRRLLCEKLLQIGNNGPSRFATVEGVAIFHEASQHVDYYYCACHVTHLLLGFDPGRRESAVHLIDLLTHPVVFTHITHVREDAANTSGDFFHLFRAESSGGHGWCA